MHVDETAVKSELKNGVTSPDADETGKERRTAPETIIIKKPAINIAEGLSERKNDFITVDRIPTFYTADLNTGITLYFRGRINAGFYVGLRDVNYIFNIKICISFNIPLFYLIVKTV